MTIQAASRRPIALPALSAHLEKSLRETVSARPTPNGHPRFRMKIDTGPDQSAPHTLA